MRKTNSFCEEQTELISAIFIYYTNENPKQRPRKKLNDVLEWY